MSISCILCKRARYCGIVLRSPCGYMMLYFSIGRQTSRIAFLHQSSLNRLSYSTTRKHELRLVFAGCCRPLVAVFALLSRQPSASASHSYRLKARLLVTELIAHFNYLHSPPKASTQSRPPPPAKFPTQQQTDTSRSHLTPQETVELLPHPLVEEISLSLDPRSMKDL